jgi:hypothetical protein
LLLSSDLNSALFQSQLVGMQRLDGSIWLTRRAGR